MESYARGETPIPCITCNQTVKFTDLLKEAKNQNADALVTGHYVRRVEGKKFPRLFKAKDSNKDQTETKRALENLQYYIEKKTMRENIDVYLVKR